jgi:hypothetical protein
MCESTPTNLTLLWIVYVSTYCQEK